MKRLQFILLFISLVSEINAKSGLRLEADFTQTKESVIFDTPARQQGNMLFVAPDSLLWIYTSPTQMRLELTGKTNNPLGNLREMIYAVIGGEIDSRQKDFRIEKQYPDNNTCHISLFPKSGRARSMFNGMEIFTGKDERIADSIIIFEPNGDKTTITFSNQKLTED